MKNEVIIIGETHHNTLSMVRCVGQEYPSVELVLYGAGRKSHIAQSKYVSKTVYLETVNDCFEYLMQRPKGKGKAVIISCSDQVAQLLDTHQKELLPNYEYFHTHQAGELTRYMDKQAQVELAASVGMKVPASYVFKSGRDLEFDGTYPCIVKPLESYVGGKRITICHHQDEVIKAVATAPIDWQIQEFIEKQSEIVLAGVATRSEVVISGYVFKHRELRGGTTYATVYPLDERMEPLVECAKKMIKAIGYEGLFGFEFIFDGHDYYFLELNLRNDATSYAYKVAGVNLPLIYLQDKERKAIAHNISRIKLVDSMVEPKDFLFVRTGEVGLWEWLNQLRHSKCKYLYDRKDIKPFLFYFLYALQRKF